MGKNARYLAAGKRAWEPSQLALAAKALESAAAPVVQDEDDATQRSSTRSRGLEATGFYDMPAHSIAPVGWAGRDFATLCLDVVFINPVHNWDRKAWSAQREMLQCLDSSTITAQHMGIERERKQFESNRTNTVNI
uniref:Uncharacterized protein n=1 Tax=Mycena chlorophos TaxID=658473 RepID=A0ABQ0L1B4_MYCCL|nr:predicted protein [Mycena chlorophos]